MSTTPGRLLAIGAIFVIFSASVAMLEGSTSKVVTRTYIVVVLLAKLYSTAGNGVANPERGA